MTGRPTVALLVIIVGVTLLTACQPSEPDNNTQIMEDAARALTFSIPGNQAYMVEKISGAAALPGVRSKVAVLFGYGDNRVICKEIAEYLMERSDARGAQYDCNVID
jgi:hypothetical protein